MQYVAGAQAFIDTLPPGTAELQILACEANDDKQINDIKALLASKGKNVILFVDRITRRISQRSRKHAKRPSILDQRMEYP
jgi:hypothetical protein